MTTTNERGLTYAAGVVETDDLVCAELVLMLSGLAPAASYTSVPDFTHTHSGLPTVLVLGPSFMDPNALAQFAEVSRTMPEVKTVGVMADFSPKLMQAAMRAGVTDVISAEDDQSQLIAAVEGAAEGLAFNPAPVLQQVPALPVVSQESSAPPLGRVISVYSAKGGAGKSVVATNLAVVLARRTDDPVILIDADLQFGDMAVMLKLQPRHTIMDVVTNMNRLDTTLLKSLLIRHEDSGLYVLAAPLEPAFADQVTPQDMKTILQLCREIGAYVVVDTPSYLTEIVMTIIEESDEVLLIAGMDIPNIKNVKVVLQSLRQLGFPMERLRLALNRANSKVKLDVGEVEKALGLSAEVLIPSDIVIPRSVNKGVPAVIDAPKSEVADAFENMANLYTQRSTAQPTKKSRFF